MAGFIFIRRKRNFHRVAVSLTHLAVKGYPSCVRMRNKSRFGHLIPMKKADFVTNEKKRRKRKYDLL